MASRRQLLLAWSLTMSTTTHALPPPSLSARNTCTSNSNLNCPKGTLCIPLAGDTTILCCPANVDCDSILPIVCDISQQDPAKFPNAPIKTSLLDDDDLELESCGDGCCPFGFSCRSDKDGEAKCRKDADQSKSPKDSGTTTSSTTSSSTPTPSSSTISSPTTTTTETSPAETSTSAEEAEAEGTTPKPKLTSIIGGVIGGCLILLILAVIILLYIRRRRRRRGQHHTTGAQANKTFYEKPNLRFHSHTRSGSNSNSSIRHLKISEPIVQPDAYRTDFVLKSPSAASSISNRIPVRNNSHANSQSCSRLSIPNPFSSAQSPAVASQASFSSVDEYSHSHHHHQRQQQLAKTGMVRSAKLPPIRNMKASSSYSRRRTPSARQTAEGENIDVFADPTTVAPGGRAGEDDHRITTFSDMMAQADLGGVHRGEKYVPGSTPRI